MSISRSQIVLSRTNEQTGEREVVHIVQGDTLVGADLSGLDLSRVEFKNLDMTDANLSNTTLSSAFFSGVDLTCANLSGAKMDFAVFRKVDASGANFDRTICTPVVFTETSICRASFINASLQENTFARVNAIGADFTGANLSNTMMSVVDLRGAIVNDADFTNTKLATVMNIPKQLVDSTNIVPQGEIVVYKRICEGIIRLRIPADATRSCATSRKCRASSAVVLELPPGVEVGHSLHDPTFEYREGATIVPRDGFDTNRWAECASGIHFFLTQDEAMNYQ